MSDNVQPTGKRYASRRDFLKSSGAAVAGVAGVAVAGSLSVARSAHAAGSDLIRIALIGAGGRGRGAAVNALSNSAHPNVKLVAVADAFRESVDAALASVQKRCPDKVDVPEERKFVGLDAYRKAIDSGVDMVLLCTPPGFRPMQFEAAVEASKIIFMEKPVAVDAPGYRRVVAANERAKKKNLMVAVGLNRRHNQQNRDAIRQVQDGAIGPVKYMRTYFNSSGVWVRPRQPGQTEMQFQVNNWYYFNWLSGDHITEQHVHCLDTANWIVSEAHPTKANGMGGRQVRTDRKAIDEGNGPGAYGEIFDHHAVEYDYADGCKLFSFCRHIPNCWNSVANYAYGTKGRLDMGRGETAVVVDGQAPMTWPDDEVESHQAEHDHLFAALLAGRPYNEGDYGAVSTMTAILGRMATYSGKEVTWEEAVSSELDLSPSGYSWDATPPVLPNGDGNYPIPMPGVTKAW
jgi:predicted dehydrogenase